MQTKQDILQGCKVEGMTIKLPAGQLDRKLYQDVAKSLELIGGKWKGGKVMGFEFKENPTALLSEIANGSQRNLKKEFQFFGTPDKLADKLVQLANIDRPDLMVLEPSAGQCAIINAIVRQFPHLWVHCCELMEINQNFIEKNSNAHFICADFLKMSKEYYFDRIIANPPFTKNQDIDHIIKMYLCCKPGGKIVSIASKHWQYSSNRKEQQFKEWLQEVNAEIIEIESDEFKESGTNISTCIIIINK